MKMFGVLDLETLLIPGCRFAIGIRNSHDKSMRLELTIGARVLVCMNMALQGDSQPLFAKHSKSFSLIDAISGGVDRIKRNFEPMRRQVATWRAQQLTNATAKLIVYRGSSRTNWTPRSTERGVCINCTLRRSTKTSNPVRCGACRMPLPRRSRNCIPFRSSRPRRSLDLIWSGRRRPDRSAHYTDLPAPARLCAGKARRITLARGLASLRGTAFLVQLDHLRLADHSHERSDALRSLDRT